jgi:pimeloyl-ACP methyl ester carboxylesterase
VPRDHAKPTAGTITLDVVRIPASAGRGQRHDGALLVEPDEFAAPMEHGVPDLVNAWLDGDAGWRQVTRRLDIVGLAPRRMDDAGGHDCLSATAGVPRYASLGTDMSFDNVMKAEDLARAIATSCQNDPMHEHVGFRPRVEDMEMLRKALGESKLHLLGVGRGGWVAARYAARFPQNVGRMVLDGSWDGDGSVAEAVEARVHERGRTLRRAIAMLVESPDRYGWGADATAVSRRLVQLPPSIYSVWIRQIHSVHDLSAVLVLARALESDPTQSANALRHALAAMPVAGRA